MDNVAENVDVWRTVYSSAASLHETREYIDEYAMLTSSISLSPCKQPRYPHTATNPSLPGLQPRNALVAHHMSMWLYLAMVITTKRDPHMERY